MNGFIGMRPSLILGAFILITNDFPKCKKKTKKKKQQQLEPV